VNPNQPVFYLVFVSLLGLAGCSWLQEEDDCPDCNIELSKGQSEKSKYYCYGKKDRTWVCETQEDDSKAIAITPRESQSTQRAVLPPPPAPLSDTEPTAAPVKSPEPAKSKVPESATSEAINLFDAPLVSYIAQLIAVRQLDPVLNYAKQASINNPLYSRIINQLEPWHSLLLGIYEDYNSAVGARDDLRGTRSLKVDPWVRKLGPLQNDISLTESPY
jgi:septal ring-binding cell division protein DamX